MITFSAEGEDGQQIIGVGLSHENLRRLKDNQPIANEQLPGIKLLIFAGETEASIEEQLQEFIGPDTKVKR